MAFNVIDAVIQPHMSADALTQPQVCQVGCNLYAVFGDTRIFPHDSHATLMYKSTDAVNWTLLDDSNSPYFGKGNNEVQVSLSVYQGTIYALGGVAIGAPSPPFDTFDASSNMKYWTFNPAPPIPFDPNGVWVAKTALQAVQQTSVHDFLAVRKFFGTFRPDGSYVLAYTIIGIDGNAETIVRKRTVGGVWSTLATFSSPSPDDDVGALFQSGLMITDGTIYLTFLLASSVDDAGTLRVASISTSDVVSGMMLIEANITAANQGSPGGNYTCQADFISGEIAFAYPANITSWDTALGDMHIARGDISVTPLAPTWTIEVAASGNSSTPSFPGPSVGVVYLGSDIHVYWAKPNNANPQLATGSLLYRSVKHLGVWGVPSLLYTDNRGPNGQLNVIKYNNQVGFLWAVQGFGPLFQGSSQICPAIEVDLTFNLALALNPSAPPPPGGPPPQPGVVPRRCIPQS